MCCHLSLRALCGQIYPREGPYSAVESIGGVAVNQDVTELTRIQDELRRSHEELDARVARRTEEVSRTATGRKIAEEELRRQQALLQYIIDFLPHFIFWKDREARLLGGNKIFLTEALGVNSVEEMIGKTDYDYFPKEQADYFRKCDFAVMESGEPMLDIEEAQSQSGKGERTLLTCKVPLRDENGAIIGLLGSYADITERKRTERELEEAKKAAEAATEAKSEFLATISHELRTPLTLILGPLETILCRGGAELPGDVREQLERIQRNAARLYVLVNDILDFTKAEAGKMQANWELVDAGALASEIVSDAEPAARNPGAARPGGRAEDRSRHPGAADPRVQNGCHGDADRGAVARAQQPTWSYPDERASSDEGLFA